MSVSDVRNRAIEEWIYTFPNQDRLAAFLASVDEAERETVRRDTAQALSDAEGFLYDWPEEIGKERTAVFLKAYSDHLTVRHPWLSQEALARLWGYARYLIWHDGL